MENKSLYRKVKKYISLLKEQSYTFIERITDVSICPCDYKKDNVFPPLEKFVPFNVKENWGDGVDTHAWFHFNVPSYTKLNGDKLMLKIFTDKNGWDATNPQFIAYVDGEMRQGFDVNHTEIILDGTKAHDVYVYGYVGVRVSEAKFIVETYQPHFNVEKLYYDLRVPFEVLDLVEEYGYEYSNILRRLDDCLLLLNLLEVPSVAFYQSVDRANEYMDKEFYGSFCGNFNPNAPTVYAIGHTHIDCAWFWTLEQTKEKVQRSFSTVVELMSRYPEYRFTSSQALLYKYMKEEAPETYERIKNLVKAKKWEVEGSMWVEADCNLSSGESLVRQIIYGKRFFKEEFGVDNRILWLPDVFGYSAALPQILRKCGIDWFVTSKINQNEKNVFPFDTFDWQGIDGTGIHSYLLSAQDKKKGVAPEMYTTYVAYNTPAMNMGTYERYQQKAINNDVILTYGYGDGGGGPNAEQLEMARRLSKGIANVPKSKTAFVGEFLDVVENNIKGNARLPVWRGELYFEHHRGTYTSIHKIKKNNRKAEFLYLNTEWLSTLAKLLKNVPFPKEDLRRGWELILTNQFHDIIPGSSIKEVYDRSDLDYAKAREIGYKHYDFAKQVIAGSIDKSKGYVIFNPLSVVGNGLVRVDGTLCYVEGISPKGYSCVKEFKNTNSINVTDYSLENAYFKLVFDEQMNLSSVYDKRNDREVIRAGERGNVLRVYEDYPDVDDAWEWCEYSLESYRDIKDVESVEKVIDGVRAGLRTTRKHLNSTIIQTVWLYDVLDRIDFDVKVDWHEKHQMLKTVFPIDVNGDFATYEIQYGNVRRPTHKNTSWDAMKFEVCAHKYVDLSEGNYGVSLLNDCKYGYDIHDGEMAISLLRSPTYPYPDADQGEMECVYSLVPHAKALDAAKISAMAYALNNPMEAVRAFGSSSTIAESFFAVTADKENVFCEVVKEAESGEATVFRFYENSNSKTKAKLTFGFEVDEVLLCDMLENVIESLRVEDNSVTLTFNPFEIVTLMVKNKN